MRDVLVAVFGTAGVLGVVSALLTLRGSARARAGLPMTFIMGGSGLWAGARALAYAAGSTTATVLFESLAHIGAVLMTTAAFCYLMELAGRRVGRRGLLLLGIEPTLLAVTLATDPWHHAYVTGTEVLASGAVVTHHGLLNGIQVGYSYALLGAAFALLATAAARAVVAHRSLQRTVLVGGAVPLVGQVASLLWRPDGLQVDVAPVLFVAICAAWFWADVRVGVVRVVPVSTRQVLSVLDDAVLVLEPSGRIMDANPAAARLLRTDAESVVGLNWSRFAPSDLLTAVDRAGQHTVTTASGRSWDVRVWPVGDRLGAVAATVLVVRDVTEVERLRHDLADQALRDGLTGLHNRRHLDLCLPEAVERAHRTGEVLAGVLVDIDHFKAVNDTYGHRVGDEVLAAVARALSAHVRPGDVVTRYGGDEFVVLLPGATSGIARRRADDWRAEFADRVALVGPPGMARTTLSVGVAELGPADDGEDLLRAADRALYEVKTHGRDGVAAGPPHQRVVT